MRFAKIVFWVAGIWGLLVLAPLYFMFDLIGRNDPPPITHPGFFYGFVGVALAWQVAFIFLATDPVRYRPLMIPSVFEKVTYVAAVIVLVFARTNAQVGPGLCRHGSVTRYSLCDHLLQDARSCSLAKLGRRHLHFESR
jgi:hypothetical protein